MARAKRVDTQPTLPPVASRAQDFFPPRNSSSGPAAESIHLAYGQGADAATVRFLCSGSDTRVPDGRREMSIAPHDDPRVCPACLKARPHAMGSAVSVVAVLVTAK